MYRQKGIQKTGPNPILIFLWDNQWSLHGDGGHQLSAGAVLESGQPALSINSSPHIIFVCTQPVPHHMTALLYFKHLFRVVLSGLSVSDSDGRENYLGLVSGEGVQSHCQVEKGLRA